MSEASESQGKYDFSTDPHNLVRADVIPHDYFLEETLRALHGDKSSSDSEFNLTVILDGAVVSGMVISSKRWEELTGELLNGVFPKLGEEFGAAATMGREANGALVDNRESEGRPRMAFKFIHMRDVTINPGFNPIKFPLWRGKLSHVSGWSFGSTNEPQAVAG